MVLDFILNCDILVVGAGIGGLVATKKASLQGKKVCLVTGKFCGGASYFPLKGTLGIQGTDGEKDKALFYEDIEKIGNKMENPHMIKTYIEDIEKYIPSLDEIGFKPWLRGDRRPACFAKYPRNIYLIKEWDKARQRAKEIFYNLENLEIIEDSTILKILKDEDKIMGAVFQRDKKFFAINAPVIIMATGGVAGNFKHKLYPEEVAGIGHIVSLDAGAKAQNMEFIQFIPAFLEPKYNTLFGEHTAKYCLGMYSLDKNLILDGINSPYKDLWVERSSYAPFSFDFKSHLIDLKMVEFDTEKNQGVILKYSDDLYKDEGEFYKVYLDWLSSIGIDMCRDEVVISPFAHSSNGGIRVNENGKTCINGLYAIGELSSAIEGANRLGGNSVGGALVFGNRAVIDAVGYLENIENKAYSKEVFEEKFTNWIDEIASNDEKNGSSPSEILEELKKVTTRCAGIKRSKALLEEGLSSIKSLKTKLNIKKDLKNKGLEAYLRLEVSQMLIKSMLAREESRGAHYREDFPRTLDNVYKIIISRKNNSFILEKKYLLK